MTKTKKTWTARLSIVCASFLIGGVAGAAFLADRPAESQGLRQPTLPPNTPVPTTNPSLSTPIPLTASQRQLPTPPAPPRQSPVETTRQVIAAAPAEFKRQLTPEVVAFQIRPPHRDVKQVVVYHSPSGSYVIMDANGNEVSRKARDANEQDVPVLSQGLQTVQEALSNATLKARALELVR